MSAPKNEAMKDAKVSPDSLHVNRLETDCVCVSLYFSVTLFRFKKE